MSIKLPARANGAQHFLTAIAMSWLDLFIGKLTILARGEFQWDAIIHGRYGFYARKQLHGKWLALDQNPGAIYFMATTERFALRFKCFNGFR